MDLKEIKKASPVMGTSNHEMRLKALENTASKLHKYRKDIFNANTKDLEAAKKENMPFPILSRLKFDETKLNMVIKGLEDLKKLPDPLGKIQLKRELDKDLLLTRITIPIGVIGVIFESRPDALVQISGLCIKSGNCAILKGGREASNTNQILFHVFQEALKESSLPVQSMALATSREEVGELLKYDEYIDLIIPRGSNEFVQHIMSDSNIPVMGHADGICHIFVDASADLHKAAEIINDSKLQYPAACNAVETLLLHENIYDELLSLLSKDITIRKGDYDKEFLDTILSVKKISGLEDAINHINNYGSHHTDCIVTENKKNAETFISRVDSSGVYHNCSTRFADGFRYGFGAEVGISTGKLHARGPVGLEGLITYKYILKGRYNKVAPYAEGKINFSFKDL